jgi:hypothetical protein
LIVLARITVGWPVCRCLEGGVDLVIVVTAAFERPDLVVGHASHHGGRTRVATEEVIAYEFAVVGLVRLVVPVRCGVHDIDQRTVEIFGQQDIPLPAPDDLDDIPAGTAEERLQLLDDLAIAADRSVQALQVAVDNESQVVEFLAGGYPDGPQRLRLIHLTVTEEGPDTLVGGVLDPAVVQVTVEPRLIDRVQWAQTHRYGRELPELRHQPRVRVGGQAATGVGQLLAEPVELAVGQPAFEMGAGIDTGGGVSLEIHVVPTARVVTAAEEVVEAHLVQGRAGGIRRDVPAHADTRTLRPMHHDRGVPAQVGPDSPLDVLIAGELRFPLGGNCVDVVGATQSRNPDLALPSPLEQP